ncbi:hypothetical protein FG476_11980 [Xylella fastidiosa subsp. multiplex]|uniref:Uncharacterized protein n=1 Tax=Xylella fastidiosa subsp. multiplex TaxID=644357 RepID=A0A9Q4ML90_XYLFS|nr:hypothetical protein [Xylella fastidiosa subsp. multiplex]MBE0274398.1 hypothetical protein [Xylella fastidiosa subsp. multiplex]MBE0276799.1 hypothetical protein [Xylella fastidiosa subsp. multiplex]MBE0281207.1 hypothetical protein [Xylella fastidiosa subsp. multiplex]MRT54308.1 hypothetical protein [Xylella fastidiosa subsp. multiplex]
MSHLDHNRNFCMGYCNHHNGVDIYGTPVHCRKCAPHLFLVSADDVNGPLRDYLDLRYRLSRPVSLSDLTEVLKRINSGKDVQVVTPTMGPMDLQIRRDFVNKCSGGMDVSIGDRILQTFEEKDRMQAARFIWADLLPYVLKEGLPPELEIHLGIQAEHSPPIAGLNDATGSEKDG